MVARVVADTVDFNRGMAQVQARTAETAAATNAAASRQGSAAKRMSTLSKVAVGGVAVAVYKAARSFMDYDKQMNITQRITGATEGQMKKLRDQSVALGADVRLPGVSAADAAKGMQELARAGFKVPQVQEAITGTMLLGTAAQIDYADAAKITAQAINTFGLAHSKATHVADLFAASANASQSEVGDIADAFRYSASQAQQAGVGIEDLTLLIAQLSNKGIEASVAGTSLRAMFTRLEPHTTRQTAAWKELGLLTEQGKSKFFDAKGAFIGVSAAADLFANSMKGLTTQQRVNLSHDAFGVAATRGMFAAFGNGSKELDRLQKKMGKIDGSAARVAEANMKGLAGAIGRLTNAVETLGLMFGEALAPWIIVAADALTAMIGPLSRHKTLLRAVAGALALVTGALVTARIALALHALATGASATAVWGFTAALLANPLTWIAIAIIAVIVALRKMGVSFDDFVRGWKIIVGTITGLAQSVIDWFRTNWQDIVTWILFPYPRLIRAIIDNWGTIKKVIMGAASRIWEWVRDKFWQIVHFIENIAPQAYEYARNLGSEIARGVLDGLGSIAEQVSEKINPFHRPFKWAGGVAAGLTGAGSYNPPVLGQTPGTRASRYGGQRAPLSEDNGTRRGAAVNIEQMHVHNDADAHKVTTMLGRKVSTR